MTEPITTFWMDMYKRKRGVRYAGFQKRDAVILHKMVAEYGEATVRALILRFLVIEDEPYLRRSGWDTRAFSSRIRGLYVEHVKAYGEKAVEEANEKRKQVAAVKDPQVLSLLDRIAK